MLLFIAQEMIWQGTEHAVPISFHWMKLAAWLMEIIRKGYNRWGNQRSRTTYVILCDEPWKKETDTSGHDTAPCFLPLPVSFLLGLGSDTISAFIARQHRLIQHCFFLPGPPYFGLSRQNLHIPQSSPRQAGQLWQRVLLEPEIVSTIQ